MALQPVRHGILSLHGDDRIGTVATGTGFVRDRDGSILQAHATKLADKFLLNLLFSAAADNFNRMETEFADELADFRPSLMPAKLATEDRDSRALKYDLDVYSYEAQGIVNDLAALMVEQGVDIVQLSGATFPAPHGGTPLFVTQMKLDVPNSIAVRNIRRALYEFEQHRGWDHDFRPQLCMDLEVAAHTMYPPSRWQKRHMLARKNHRGRVLDHN
jgi:glycine cleavage system transcriptional repressor